MILPVTDPQSTSSVLNAHKCQPISVPITKPGLILAVLRPIQPLLQALQRNNLLTRAESDQGPTNRYRTPVLIDRLALPDTQRVNGNKNQDSEKIDGPEEDAGAAADRVGEAGAGEGADEDEHAGPEEGVGAGVVDVGGRVEEWFVGVWSGGLLVCHCV